MTHRARHIKCHHSWRRYLLLCFCRRAAYFSLCWELCNQTCRQGLCWHKGPCSHLWVSARKENLGLEGGGNQCKRLLCKSHRLSTRLNDQEWIQEAGDTVAAVSFVWIKSCSSTPQVWEVLKVWYEALVCSCVSADLYGYEPEAVTGSIFLRLLASERGVDGWVGGEYQHVTETLVASTG